LHTKQLKKKGRKRALSKSEIKAFIGHHVLEFFSVRRGRRGALWFRYRGITGTTYFHLLDLIMEKQWQNLMVFIINHHDGKIYKTDASGTLTEGADIQRNGRRLIFQSRSNRVF
jgi:F-type H+-transporting ATPase subunit a